MHPPPDKLELVEELGLAASLSIFLCTLGETLLMNDLIEQSWAKTQKVNRNYLDRAFPPKSSE